MRSRSWLCVPVVLVAAVLAPARSLSLHAQAPDAAALTGRVTSAEEGAMEGVLVSVKQTGSPMTTTVVSDRQGRYRFPQSRLAPLDVSVEVERLSPPSSPAQVQRQGFGP